MSDLKIPDTVKISKPRSFPVRVGIGIYRTVKNFMQKWNEMWEVPSEALAMGTTLGLIGGGIGFVLGIFIKAIGIKGLLWGALIGSSVLTLNIVLNIVFLLLALPFMFVKQIAERMPKE